jgi:aryl-alcohol dehydrogenase-like predicted oxidoreductase
MKLALGTAQFGFKYGISNYKDKVPLKEQIKIINLCRNNNINLIDTAVGYGESESSIGKLGIDDFEIITKIPSLEFESNVDASIRQYVDKSLNKLKIKQLYGLLLHNPKDLSGKNYNIIKNTVKILKSEKKIMNFGVSVYSPKDLSDINNLSNIEIVQAPLNVVDRRFLRSGWLKRLYLNKIEVHVRSAFLQGLLLMDSKIIPKNFYPWNKLWNNWNDLSKCGFTKIELCIQYLKNLDGISRIIIGVQDVHELMEIIKAYNKDIQLPDFDAMECEDEKLINPMNWSR